MKHKLAPVSGAPGAAGRSMFRMLARSLGLALILLAASSAARAQVVVSVAASDPNAAETPADNGTFLVQATGIVPNAITIAYQISGSATPGDDYTSLSGEVVVNPGQPQQTVAVSVPGNDNAFEGDETIILTLLDDPEGDYIVLSGPATVTIADSAHSVTASTASHATENPVDAGQITVSLGASNESGSALTVNYSVAGTATSGTDYMALSGVAAIPTGASSVPIAVTPLDDDEVEGDETVAVTLTSTSDARAPVGDPATASVSISDAGEDDDVEVSITASDASAGEAPADQGEFLVSRVGGSSRAVTISFSVGGSATPGDDYAQISPPSVSLAEGASEARIAVKVAGDAVFEGDETVTVTLQEEDGIDVQGGGASVTIHDSAHAVTAARESNASENPVGVGRILVSLGARNESGSALTVQYSVAGTATAATDYAQLGGSVSIPAGSSSANIDVTPLNDDLLEPDETVEVTLTSTSDSRVSVGQPASASLSIADDDSAGDDDGDGVSNDTECPDFARCPDTDEDGLPDYRDPDDDGDGVPTASENAPGQDTDNDGDPDYLDNDDDGDGRPTTTEDANEDGDGNPATDPTDIDGDDVPDYLDADDTGGPAGDIDGDGLSNQRELELGTDPEVADTDGDAVNDGAEVDAGTDPLDARSFADADGDLVPDTTEAADGTDPNDPDSFRDGDGGGTADHVETITYASFGIAPTDVADAGDDRRDLDGDGLPDRLEIAIASEPDAADSPTPNGAGDNDADSVSNAVEAHLETFGIVDVDGSSDLDRDGYPDAREVTLGLNALRANARDADGDGVPDVIESLAGLDIDATTDSDGDGVPDARELALGSDPLDANSPVVNGAMDDDGDAISNAIEQVLQGLAAPDDIDAGGDNDEDGIGNADEIRFGTDPFHDEQPVPWIELSQDDIGGVNALVPGGGTAEATAVTGGHQAGTLVYDWSGSDNAILAVTSGSRTARTLTFSAETLPAGAYTLVVDVQRTVGGYTSPLSVVEFPLSVLADADAAQVADADNDGVPDSSDDVDARTGFANELPARPGSWMQTASGLRLQLGSTARSTRSSSASITRQDIANAGDGHGGSVGNSEDDFDYLSGIYDFEVTNLPEAGSVVQIVIPKAAAIGEFPEYRKFRPESGWGNFTEDANNIVESAAGSAAGCPAPGDDSYQAGLTAGHLCVQLTIEDGGPNDGDAALGPNGVIKDPSGVATPKGEVSVGSGSGSTGPVALIVIGLFAIGALRRRSALA